MFTLFRINRLLKRATQLSHDLDRGGFVDMQEVYRLENKIRKLQEKIMHLAPFNAVLKEYFPHVHMEVLEKKVRRKTMTIKDRIKNV